MTNTTVVSKNTANHFAIPPPKKIQLEKPITKIAEEAFRFHTPPSSPFSAIAEMEPTVFDLTDLTNALIKVAEEEDLKSFKKEIVDGYYQLHEYSLLDRFYKQLHLIVDNNSLRIQFLRAKTLKIVKSEKHMVLPYSPSQSSSSTLLEMPESFLQEEISIFGFKKFLKLVKKFTTILEYINQLGKADPLLRLMEMAKKQKLEILKIEIEKVITSNNLLLLRRFQSALKQAAAGSEFLPTSWLTRDSFFKILSSKKMFDFRKKLHSTAKLQKLMRMVYLSPEKMLPFDSRKMFRKKEIIEFINSALNFISDKEKEILANKKRSLSNDRGNSKETLLKKQKSKDLRTHVLLELQFYTTLAKEREMIEKKEIQLLGKELFRKTYSAEELTYLENLLLEAENNSLEFIPEKGGFQEDPLITPAIRRVLQIVQQKKTHISNLFLAGAIVFPGNLVRELEMVDNLAFNGLMQHVEKRSYTSEEITCLKQCLQRTSEGFNEKFLQGSMTDTRIISYNQQIADLLKKLEHIFEENGKPQNYDFDGLEREILDSRITSIEWEDLMTEYHEAKGSPLDGACFESILVKVVEEKKTLIEKWIKSDWIAKEDLVEAIKILITKKNLQGVCEITEKIHHSRSIVRKKMEEILEEIRKCIDEATHFTAEEKDSCLKRISIYKDNLKNLPVSDNDAAESEESGSEGEREWNGS